jgi:hypothetical protein
LEFPWGIHSIDIFICRRKYTYTPAESENLGSVGWGNTRSISDTLKTPFKMPASNFSIFSSVYSVLCGCKICASGLILKGIREALVSCKILVGKVKGVKHLEN